MLKTEDQTEIIASHQKQAPVHVVTMAIDLGLKVYRAHGWKDELSGYIRREEDKNYSIFVNGKHHERRRRFTIAHEIGHFILHRDLIGDGVVDDALYRSRLSSQIEAQANRFAANILMPKHLIIEAIKEKKLRSVGALAELFNVAKSAMSIRLGVPFETKD